VATCECGALVASYERLTALYHDLLGQESLAALLERAAEAVTELVPCSSLLIASFAAPGRRRLSRCGRASARG